MTSSSASRDQPDRLPMLWYQGLLPTLPVPSLAATATGIPDSLEPVDPALARATRTGMVDLVGGVGPTLQNRLLERASGQRDWLSDWWDHAAYLDQRGGLLEANPACMMPTPHSGDQAAAAAHVTCRALEFWRLILAESLEPEFNQHGAPMCMDGYTRMFGATRIPGRGRDEFVLARYETEAPVVVFHRGRPFALNVPLTGALPSQASLEGWFRQLLELPLGDCASPVGALTCLPRESYAVTRAELRVDPVSKRSLEVIDTALFVVSLDDEVPRSRADSIRWALAGQPQNRWCDKGIQLLVAGDGQTAVSIEHTGFDGTALRALIQYVGKSAEPRSIGASQPAPRPLPWGDLTGLQGQIALGVQTAKNYADDIDVSTTSVSFDRELLKARRLSPDAILQLTLQLAFRELRGQTPLTYEAAQTRQFYRGRTEAVRSATKQTQEFAVALDRGLASEAELFTLLSAASNRHRELTAASANGRGIDRHLLALRMVALECEVELPPALQSGGTLEGWDLSTSSLPDMEPSMFAPAKGDGYGVGYRPTGAGADMTITSRRSGGRQGSEEFAAASARAQIGLSRVIGSR